MNNESQVSPEVFEDIINDFIVGENNLLINYVVVHDVKLNPDDNYEHYVLNVTVYLKEGNIVGERFRDFTVSIGWNSFVDRLSRNKVFKKYLGLPLNDNYSEFYISMEGEIKEGYPKKEKITETRDLIKKILKEELSTQVRRRINFDSIDDIIRKNKIVNFKKDQPIEDSIKATMLDVMYDIMPSGYEDDDTEYYKVWDEIKDYLQDKYSDELTKYFEKRQKDVDEYENPLDIRYVFIKHDRPYGVLGWSGFAEGFNSFDELITKYGHWIDVDWDEIKNKLDNINNYPEDTFTNKMNSYPLRISSIGDEGNTWGYNFSIIKQIPKENISKIK
jgi:hypothetical protein